MVPRPAILAPVVSAMPATPSQPSDPRPIFIIGSPRSGTTLLRLMLDSHPRLSCGEETHFLRELEPIVGRHWRMVAPYGFDRDYWLAHIREFYVSFQRDVLDRRAKLRWAEKDPTYTLQLPFLAEVFPDAQYVHLIRDGHDVVASFRDRWGYRSAARAARSEWRRYVLAARACGGRSAVDGYHELRYETLVADPELVMRDLLSFLGEPWDAAVLKLDAAGHQGTERYQRFSAERRQAGGDSSAIYRSRVGAGRSELDPLLRRLLRSGSGDLLRELGYLEG